MFITEGECLQDAGEMLSWGSSCAPEQDISKKELKKINKAHKKLMKKKRAQYIIDNPQWQDIVIMGNRSVIDFAIFLDEKYGKWKYEEAS